MRKDLERTNQSRGPEEWNPGEGEKELNELGLLSRESAEPEGQKVELVRARVGLTEPRSGSQMSSILTLVLPHTSYLSPRTLEGLEASPHLDPATHTYTRTLLLSRLSAFPPLGPSYIRTHTHTLLYSQAVSGQVARPWLAGRLEWGPKALKPDVAQSGPLRLPACPVYGAVGKRVPLGMNQSPAWAWEGAGQAGASLERWGRPA